MDNADILDKVATAPAISEPTQDRDIDPIANYEKYEPLYRRAEAENVFNWVRDNYDDDAESVINLTDFFATNYGVSRENAYHNMDTYITDYIGKTVPRKTAWQQIKDGYTDGRISDKEGRLYNRLMWTEDDEAKKSIQFQIDKLESQRPSRDGNTTTGLTPWLESANNLLGTMVRPLITSAAVSALFPQSMMLTVFSGLGKAAPLIANIGAKALSTGVVFNETRKVETGLIYKDMIENGVQPDIARKNAVAHGIIAGALETASIEVLLARFPFMKKAAQNAFMKLTARERMTQGAVKAIGKIIADNALSIPIGVVSETTTEVLQEMSAIYFEKRADLQSIDDKELAKIMANKQGEFEKYFDEEIRQAKKDYYVSDEYIKECKDRIWDVAKQTAKGMAVFGLLGAGANTISDIRTNARQTGIYKNASEQLESMKSDLDKARDNLAEKKEAFQNDPLNEQKKAEYDKAKTEVADKEAAYNLTPDAAEYGEIISKRELTDEDIERLAELDARSQLRREREAEENPDWQKAPEDIEHAEPQTLDVGEQRLREIIKAYTPNLTDPETDEIVNLLNVRARALGQELDTYLSNTFQTEMARYTTDDTATVIRNGKEEKVRFKGNVDFAKDGKAIITLTHKADFSTWVHELGHIFRRQIAGDLLTEAERYYGVQDGVWTVDAEERFTEDLTNYLMTRKAPNSTLEKMFRIIADALHNVYDRFTKRGEVSDDIARVFDQMFNDPGSAYSTQADYSYDADSTLFQENPEERAEAERQYNEVVAKYKNTDQWMKAPNGKPTKLTERQWVQVRTPNFIRWFGDWINDPDNASKVLDPDTKEPMVVYHGTTSENRFEVFDAQKGYNINAIWHSKDKSVASHWSGTSEATRFDNTLVERISEQKDWDSLAKLVKDELGMTITPLKTVLSKKEAKEWGGKAGTHYGFNIEYSSGVSTGIGDAGVKTEAELIERVKRDIIRTAEDVIRDTANYRYGYRDSFTYADFLNISNPLIVDADGEAYHNIKFDGERLNTESIAEIARERNYDGVIINNVLETDYENIKTDDYITFDPTQIKSATDNVGTFSQSNPSILFQTDTEYLDAVNTGNMAKAQAMVDARAREMGYNSPKLYHWTSKDFDVFDTSKSGENQGQRLGDGIYMATNPHEFSYAGNKRLSLYANIQNPFKMELTEEQAEQVYDKYFAPHHDDEFGVYKPHVVNSLQSAIKVFDYLKQAAKENDTRTSAILQDLGYDGIKDGMEWVAFSPNQVKSADPVTYDDNGNVIPLSQRFNDSHSSLLFQSAYHGSGASFDKFDTDFMGTGEGNQSFGWGMYLTQSEGIARSYAEKMGGGSKNYLAIQAKIDFLQARRKSLKQTENKERYEARILKNIRNLNKDLKRAEKEGNEKDIKFYKDLIEISENDLKEESRQALIASFKADIAKTEQEIRELQNAKLNRNLYTASIPDDTGSNYLYWDRPIGEEALEKIRNAYIPELVERNQDWLKKGTKEQIVQRVKSGMSFDRELASPEETGKQIYDDLINLLGSDKDASEFLNRAGFVGIDYPASSMSGGNKYGKRNFVIFNADDITIDNHLLYQENEEIYRDATENGEYVPDNILEQFRGNEWADMEIAAREDYRKTALEYEDDYTKFLEFNRTFDISDRTDDYYNEVYNSAFTGDMQSREEANRQFLDSMTHDEMEKILNIIAKTDAFRSGKVGSPHKVVDKTLYGMMNGDKKLSESNYKRIKAMMNDDPDAWREFVAMAFEDQEQYELIQKQKALFPKSEVEKLRETNRQLRQDIARKDKSLKDVNARIADLQDTIHFWRTRLNTTQEKLEAKLEEAAEDKEWLKAKAQIEKYKAWQKAKEKMDAEKIKAGMKLESTKEKFQTRLADQKAYYQEKLAELRRAYNERAYYQRLIRIIFKKPPKMCDITIAKEIESIQAQYSPTSMTDRTKTRLELALMDATNDKQKAKIMGMLTRKSLRDMTLAEVADLADRITELRAEGVAKRQQQLLDIKEKRLDIEAGLVSDLGETEKLDRTGSIESKKSKGRLWDRMKGYWWDINRLTEDMGEHWEAFFKDEVGKAYQDELRNIDRRRTALLDRMKELKLTAETLSKTEKIDDRTYTHDILLHWYICMQNADSMAALVYGNFEGDPNNKALMDKIESTIKEGIGKLSQEEIDLAEWMINSFSGDDRARLWDVFRNVENRSPEMILRYFPMIRQVSKVQDVQNEPLVDLGERTTAGRAAVKKNFSLERIHDIAWQHQTPLKLGAMSIYMQAIQNQEHYIAFAQLSKDMKYVYNGISDQVIAKYGQNFYDNLNKWIDRVINPNAYKARYAQQNIFMKALSNSMAGALAGNVVTMIKQAPSMLFFLPYCNAGYMAQALYNFATDHKGMTAFAKEKSPYLANRNIDDVLTNLNEQLADPNSKFRKARQITNALLKPIAWIDEFACVVGWNAVYTTEMSKGATEAEAVEKANEALLKTQPQATAIYSPQAYNSGSDLMRTILVFTRQANQIYQMVTADMGHLAAEKQFKRIVAMGFVLALNALLMGWIGRKFAGYGDDDEGAIADMAKDIAANLANNIPVVGPTIVPMIQRSAYTSSGYVNPISEMLNKTHRAVYKSIKAGEIDFDTAMRLITDAMGTAGLPKVMAWRAYKALKDEDIWTLFIGAPLGGKDGSK